MKRETTNLSNKNGLRSVGHLIYFFSSHIISGIPVLEILYTVFTRLNAAAFIKFSVVPIAMRRLFEGGVYFANNGMVRALKEHRSILSQ